MIPEFSVVVPVYLVQAYLGEALRSVTRQTFGRWECLCVDDGSQDACGDLLDAAARADGRFRIIHQRNAGVASARNRALARVRGKWLLFLDGDDAVSPEWLRVVYDLSNRYPEADLIAFRMGKTREEVTVTPEGAGNVRILDVAAGLSPDLTHHSFWEFAYRAMRGGEIRFRPFTHSEDVLFMTEWFFHARQAVLAEVSLYWYRRRACSATTAPISVARLRSEWGAWGAILALYVSGKRLVPRMILRNCEKVLSLSQIAWMARLPDRRARAEWYRFWRWALLRMAWRTHGTTSSFRASALLFWATPWYTICHWFVGRCVRMKAWLRKRSNGARDFLACRGRGE